MAKNYTDKLAEWVGQRESTRRDKNLVAFLAVRDDVEAALRTGFTARTVWLNLYEDGRVPFRYTTFLALVSRHFESAFKSRNQVGCRGALPASKVIQQAKVDKIKKNNINNSEAIRGFTFNPIPNKEDLI